MKIFLVWLSAIIWIVMITENRDPNSHILVGNIGFSTWIAVGSSGGYLLAFISFILHRVNLKRQRYGNDPNSQRF